MSRYFEASQERHTVAVKNSFRLAQESADRGDYVDALGWINVLEAIGEQIPADVEARRRAWHGQTSVGES